MNFQQLEKFAKSVEEIKWIVYYWIKSACVHAGVPETVKEMNICEATYVYMFDSLFS